MKKGVIISIICLFFMFLAACGQSESTNQEENDDKAEATGSIEIDHALGTTAIDGEPDRVVTLYQGATDAAVALGIKPVGVVESWRQAPMYDYLKDDLGEVTYVGQETQPNLEEIAALEPDVIIASKMRHEEIYDQLSAIAPTVAHETVFAFKETLELVGKATGKEEKATKLLEDWDNRVADFQEKVASEYKGEWPLHAAVLNFRADHARIYVTGFAGSILDELGFKGPANITDKSQAVLKLTDKESITEMNADVFYLFMDDDPAVEQTYQDWTSHPLWEELDAVQSDQVNRVDEVVWNMGGGIIAANLMLDDIYDRFDLEK
ncbi:ABC transporter substrate-binding protein [Gracilibacillus caseinilyticus]|uniref:ABC transporter substrate-binding protein n=2 Tax=Gracilibacillus caseinilyticus TaxID=2932256 RepID=A0ABY4F2G3_9BACI|nr:ABC transporter substrate-binding protein [Gracilibacillus caseinilyticus]